MSGQAHAERRFKVEYGKKDLERIQRMAELYEKANKLNEELPKDLLEKMSIYGEILEIIGGLWASATNEWKYCESMRRETIAKQYALDPEGSNRDREMRAEAFASEWRHKEAIYEAESLRWKNLYNSKLEQIQILKKKYEHMKEVAKGGI
mgnify:CR=1 FL=1